MVSVWQQVVVITPQPSPTSHCGKQTIQEGTSIALQSLNKLMGSDGSHITEIRFILFKDLANVSESFNGAVTQHSVPLRRDQCQQLTISDVVIICIQIVVNYTIDNDGWCQLV